MKEEIGRTFVVLGVVLIAGGLLFLYSDRLPFRLGRLPGDIAWEGEKGSFYFPITTCILCSIVLSVIFWAVSRR
jgi:ribose/xylose/arabinose/galactoside ABC-type transport system permease subunit